MKNQFKSLKILKSYLLKTLKCLGLNAKEWNKTKTSLTKDGTIQFQPRKNTSISKKFFFEVATNLVKKLPITPYDFNSDATKYYCDDILIY